MAELRYPNRTGQEAVFNTGTPDEIDISGTTPLVGMQTFDDAITADSWVDGDQVTVLIKVDDDNYMIWLASWDETGSKLLKVSEEMSVGTVADEAAVDVSAIVSQSALFSETRLMRLKYTVGVDYLLKLEDCGKTILAENTMGAKELQIPDGLPEGFWFILVQTNSAVMEVTFTGTDELIYGLTAIATDDTTSKSLVVVKTASGWRPISFPYGSY